MQLDDGALRWWTFAGGRINHTLKYALEVEQGWRVVADNFALRVEGDGVTRGAVEAAADRLATEEFWSNPELWERVLRRLPEYRLSKFQQALPAMMARELVAYYLLDPAGTASHLVRSAARVSSALR